MLSYQQLETIARILGWTVAEVEQSIVELNNGFMRPEVDCVWMDETGEYGVCHRLSAPGYLDCTEWDGPFETEEEAVADMLSVYCD